MTKARDLSQVPNASLAFKNRIINGDCRIDQRNNGGSVAISTDAFPCDRFTYNDSSEVGRATGTLQRVNEAPTGFLFSTKATFTNAKTSSGAGNRTQLRHHIEGFNIADLGWGTANAQSITISFWVRSSVTGTHALPLNNGAENRSYVATYQINQANTWEYKSIVVPGDTSGVWQTENQIGIRLAFDFGSGTTYQAPSANAWHSGWFYTVSGVARPATVAGATWQVTGVQLEKGSTATSFDYRSYSIEQMLCERYFRVSREVTGGSAGGSGNLAAFRIDFTGMRTQPTITVRNASSVMEAMYFARYSISAIASTWAPTSNDVGIEITPTVNFPTNFPIHLFSSALNLNSEL